MGLIKILTGAVGGAIKEQTLEAFQPAPMSDTTVFAPAVPPHSNNNQYRSTEGIISNGSIIQKVFKPLLITYNYINTFRLDIEDFQITFSIIWSIREICCTSTHIDTISPYDYCK